MMAAPSLASEDRDRQLVSVVILNYNYGRYLNQSIDSVLAQDYEPLEVIVVDDGSTDDSRTVIESYANRIVASFKPNGGVVSAMNHGFALSHGAVVIFLDADDFLLQGAVSDHAQAHREPGVVRSQTYLTILKEASSHKEPLWPDTRIPGKPAAEGNLRDLVLERGPGAYVSAPQSGNAYARRFLEQVLPLPETLKGIGADALLMDSAPLFGTIVVLKSEPRAVYRVHHSGMNAAKAGMTRENIHKAIVRQEARAALLEKVASSLGHTARKTDWKARSWRLLTLDYLSSRITGTRERRPPLTTHLKPVFEIRGKPVLASMLAVTLVCMRLVPLRLSMYLASRIINLRYH